MPLEIIIKSVVAGILASLACGLGALPLFIPRIHLERHTGVSYGFSGGLMFAASVYNLILPGLTVSGGSVTSLRQVIPVIAGILLGTATLWLADRFITLHPSSEHSSLHTYGRTGMLVFLAMTIHSFPEGVAVGVGYASGEVSQTRLGSYLAVAIAIHNIPEGLAVALPLRAGGAGIVVCFLAAVLSSLPQPVAAVPACMVSWVFQPAMPVLMGFAAGAMIFLVLIEMIPTALSTNRPSAIAWSFMLGFCLMLLVQVAI